MLFFLFIKVLKQTTGTLYSRMEYVSSHLPERLPHRSPHIPSPEVLRCSAIIFGNKVALRAFLPNLQARLKSD